MRGTKPGDLLAAKIFVDDDISFPVYQLDAAAAGNILDLPASLIAIL
jgi:hypothetical protein